MTATAFVDVSGNERIAELARMFADLSTAVTPREVLERFTAPMRRIYGQRALVGLSTRDLEAGAYRITRWIDEAGVNHAPTDDPWRQRDRLTVHRGGFLGSVIATPEPKLCLDLDVRGDLVIGDELAAYHSMIAVPAYAEGQAAYWSLFLDRKPGAFDESELEASMQRVNLIGSTVLQVDALARLREANERIAEEIRTIARIQRALLPRAMPDHPDLSIAASYETFDTAGGDLYDFLALRAAGPIGLHDPASRWAFIIADVAGHGPAAAVMMAMLHAILHTYPHVPLGPGEVLAYANHHLCRKQIDGSFITALLLFYDPADARFTYARAGHPPGLIRPVGPARALGKLDDVGGLPLGIDADADYDDACVILAPGETLILYTDGITEAAGPSGQMFGVEGIEQATAQCTGDPDCILAGINRILRQHQAGVRPHDDQTLLAIQARTTRPA